MTRDLENYSVFFEMSGQPSLSSEGSDFVHLESYLLNISGEILREVGSEQEDEGEGEEFATYERGVIEQVFFDSVGTVSGVKLLAKTARAEGQDVPRSIILTSSGARAALDELELAGMFKRSYVNVLVLASVELAPEHDDLEVRLRTTARVIRELATDFDLVVAPVPSQMPDVTTWAPEKAADSRLAMSFRRLSEDWMLVLSVEGLTFAR